MNTITIPTTQNIELEYPIATVGDRIGATILDLAIQMGYVIVLRYAFSFADVYVSMEAWIILLLPIMLYSLLSEIFFNGQSIGKRILSIQVIHLEGRPPELSQYLLRWLLRPVDVLFLNGLVALISISISKYAQRLGDLAAGTSVIKLTLVTPFGETIFEEIEEGYEIQFPQVATLTDRDMSILKEVLDIGVKGSDRDMITRLTQRVKEVAGIESDLEDRVFLETVLKDYNSLYGGE